jgi:hypothetical protein
MKRYLCKLNFRKPAVLFLFLSLTLFFTSCSIFFDGDDPTEHTYYETFYEIFSVSDFQTDTTYSHVFATVTKVRRSSSLLGSGNVLSTNSITRASGIFNETVLHYNPNEGHNQYETDPGFRLPVDETYSMEFDVEGEDVIEDSGTILQVNLLSIPAADVLYGREVVEFRFNTTLNSDHEKHLEAFFYDEDGNYLISASSSTRDFHIITLTLPIVDNAVRVKLQLRCIRETGGYYYDRETEKHENIKFGYYDYLPE